MSRVTYRTTDVTGLKVFYRESGPPEGPKLLLLYGFPSAGHMFRDLIPQLDDRFHVVAPDLTGFGQAMPDRGTSPYTFEAVTDVIEGFTDVVGFDRYALYVFDYGAPTGFRLAVRRPEAISAIVSQNGNAYTEGLSDGWDPIRAYWKDRRRPTATRSAAWFSLRRPCGNTPTESPTPRWFHRTEPEPKPSSVTSPAQMSGCWKPATSRSRRTQLRSPRPSADFSPADRRDPQGSEPGGLSSMSASYGES
jgi:pimeloyl-ACP methyl ester carboxylesterase